MIGNAFRLDAAKIDGAPSDMRSLALSILTSREFQANVIDFSLTAFPSKARLLFVHIPKCGGTTINALLGRQLASLDDHVSKAEWTSQSELFRAMARFYQKVQESEFILVSQHKSLGWFLRSGLRRPGDRIFTVVRDPYEIVLSQINYIIKRFRDDPAFTSPDTASWARSIGLSRFDKKCSGDELEGIALQLFDNTNVIHFNSLCRYLGDGTAGSAIDLIRSSDIEVVKLEQMHQWLKDKWGISSEFIGNKSDGIIQIDNLDKARKDFLVNACAEDQVVYNFAANRGTPKAIDRPTPRAINKPEHTMPADAATPESMITGLYRAILQRDPDPQGLKNYLDAIVGGATLQSIVLRLISSVEFREKYAAKKEAAREIVQSHDSEAPELPVMLALGRQSETTEFTGRRDAGFIMRRKMLSC